MERKEAIKFLQETAREILSCNYGFADADESIDMAIEALRKHIPKKYARKNDVFYCDCCRRIIHAVHKYCWNCGQKIDWS